MRVLEIIKKFSKTKVVGFQRIARPLAKPLDSKEIDWLFIHILGRIVAKF